MVEPAASSRPFAGRPVIVFAGGDPSRAEDLHGLDPHAFVIAADSGAEHALALGWTVHRLVGDLDSIDPATTQRLEAAGTVVERHPEAKDKTDLALALDVACAGGAAAVTVVGGHGGRLDHLLANALLFGAERYATVELDARMGPARLTIVRRRRELRGARGDVVTLLPLGGAATGVTTDGLLFPLQEATIVAGSTWGVSNEMLAERAAVTVAGGVIAAVQPGVRGALADRAQWGGP